METNDNPDTQCEFHGFHINGDLLIPSYLRAEGALDASPFADQFVS
mgnify:CR=1 FL=1